MSKLVVGSIEGTAYSGVRIPAYARTVEKSDWSKSVASPPSPAMRYRIMALRSVLVQKSDAALQRRTARKYDIIELVESQGLVDGTLTLYREVIHRHPSKENQL